MSLVQPDDSSSDRSISVPIELDGDGFLRRACPSCEREFKWLPSDDSEPMRTGGYHCPYCGKQADADSWFTNAQLEYLEANAASEFGGELLDRLGESVQRINEGSDFVRASLETDLPTPVKPREPADMLRCDFECHPKEPVKIAERWRGPVHCLICGASEQP